MMKEKNVVASFLNRSSKGIVGIEKVVQVEHCAPQPSSQRLSARQSAMAPVKNTSGKPCDECHKKHRKCVEGVPCRLCVKQGIDCTFDRPDRRPSPSVRSGRITDRGQHPVSNSTKNATQALPTFYFTQSQLSLALSLQKSRPSDLSTRGRTSPLFKGFGLADCVQITASNFENTSRNVLQRMKENIDI